MVVAINNLPSYFTSFAKLIIFWLFIGVSTVKAEVRFDVFMGFADMARNSEWFPVTVEIENDGPSFNGVIEIKPSSLNDSRAASGASFLEICSQGCSIFSLPVRLLRFTRCRFSDPYAL